MPGKGHGNKAAGDGDFNNAYSKGGAGTGHGPHGHVAKSVKTGSPKGHGGKGAKGGHKGGMSY